MYVLTYLVRQVSTYLLTYLLMCQVLDDWRYIAMVIDRLQLYVFLAVTSSSREAATFRRHLLWPCFKPDQRPRINRMLLLSNHDSYLLWFQVS